MEDYKQTNRDWWNQAVPVHNRSDFYDIRGFLSGKTSLQETELALLGDIKGKKVLHLQCHFGQDTISLARLGATVVGVDISDKGIEKARELAAQANQTNATFICSDIEDLPQNLDEKFDIVFTSYGVVGWLPDLDKWGYVIGHFLKPCGKFVIVEFHPVVGMFDETFQRFEYGYFKSEPIVDTSVGTYADKNATVKGTAITWNHGLAEIMTGLLQNGIQIEQFKEYDYSHYACFPQAQTEEFEVRKYRFKHFGDKIPMMFSIVGIKSKKEFANCNLWNYMTKREGLVLTQQI